MWQYDDTLTHPLPFLSGVTNVPEEIGFTDEELDELRQIMIDKVEQEAIADAQKTTDKTITETLKEERRMDGGEL